MTHTPDYITSWQQSHTADMGAMIRLHRQQYGLTQVQLAHRAHMKHGTLCDIELGYCTPQRGTLTRLASAYGMSLPDYLQIVLICFQECA